VKLPWKDFESHEVKKKLENTLGDMTYKANIFTFKAFITAMEESVKVKTKLRFHSTVLPQSMEQQAESARKQLIETVQDAGKRFNIEAKVRQLSINCHPIV
jgi:hypothetical protein